MNPGSTQYICGDWTLYLERFLEPYTGIPLLGVGGDGPDGPTDGRILIQYDNQPASYTTLKRVTPPDSAPRLTFGTQLPLEPQVERIQVLRENGTSQTRLLDEPWVTIAPRQDRIAATPPTLLARVLKNITSGELFSLWRWRARWGRCAELTLRAKQKLRYKLLARQFRPQAPHDAYVSHTRLTPRLQQAMTDELKRFRYRPTISILLPTYNSDPRWLREAIDSVRGQIYDRWELCIADDASTDPKHRQFLDQLERQNDLRIKLIRRATNGHICAATNSAADLATGEFVALLDHDDRLAPQALFEIVLALQHHPDAGLLYSDEDKINEVGHRYDPQFKPDWSPELLLSYNYINHLTCIRKKLFEQAGRFRLGFHGSQDHDLLLRVTELTERVVHIPKILYHWRAHVASTASIAGQKSYVHTSGRQAVEEALRRRHRPATLFAPPFAERLGLPILALDGFDDGPSVAVIIYGPIATGTETIRALIQGTTYRNVTPYLVDDTGTPAESLNRIAAARTEDYLLFLAAGLVPKNPRWLSQLLVQMRQPEVGAVGGAIRDTRGVLHSAGTVLGLRDGIAPGHAFLGTPADTVSYYFYAEVTRTVSAPGQGCLLTPRSTFDQLGGFDAERFGRTLFDVDYAVRLSGSGLRSVHVGGVEFISSHVPMERQDDPEELRAFHRAYGRPRDPYYNPNFSERDSFRPTCDGPLSLPGEASNPAVRTLVAAHNLNNPEGAPRYLSEIVLGLTKRGTVAPTVFSPLGGAGEKVYHETSIPCDIADATWSRRFVDGLWTPREYEVAQQYLRRLLRTRRPEVVLANTMLTFPVIEAAARVGIPAVWIIHESYSANVMERLFPPFTRGRAEAAFAMAARVIPASHDTARILDRLNSRGNQRVIHNGLNPCPFDEYLHAVSRADAARLIPGPTGKVRMISVGTVCERKGQHILVEAAIELARTRSDFVIQVIGLREGVPYA
ncbi:MAG: glycosyltransferase, partial [Bacteroidales bacterium]|nr:glycosyltransferase [Bacteroidales bacterium]